MSGAAMLFSSVLLLGAGFIAGRIYTRQWDAEAIAERVAADVEAAKRLATLMELEGLYANAIDLNTKAELIATQSMLRARA